MIEPAPPERPATIERQVDEICPAEDTASNVEVVACDRGPFLVRGARSVTDESGVAHPVERSVVAVCRCGRSRELPWCDGIHKLVSTRAGQFETEVEVDDGSGQVCVRRPGQAPA